MSGLVYLFPVFYAWLYSPGAVHAFVGLDVFIKPAPRMAFPAKIQNQAIFLRGIQSAHFRTPSFLALDPSRFYRLWLTTEEGYKRATPASVARELAILGRMEHRNSMVPAADLPGYRLGALDGGSGCSGFGAGAVGLLDARKHATMRHIFGETLDDMQQQPQQQRQQEQQELQQQLQQQLQRRQQLHSGQLEQLQRDKEKELEPRRRLEEQQEEQRQHQQRADDNPLENEGKHSKKTKKRKQRQPEHLQQPPHHSGQQEHVRREQKKRNKGKRSKT